MSGTERSAPSVLAELEKLGDGLIADRPATSGPRFYEYLKFLVNDKNWLALKPSHKKIDRDELALRVWEHLETFHKDDIEEKYQSLEYHRRVLFDWLLGRYDLRRARRAIGGGPLAGWAQWFLLAGVCLVSLLNHSRLESHPRYWTLACLLIYGAVAAALGFSFRSRLADPWEAFTLALQSLVPRLAGAGAVGLLFLASSQDLLRVVIDTRSWWLASLLLAGYGYLLLEMARRVHPFPSPRRLALRGLDIAVTALAHAMALALLAEGVLRKVLAGGVGSHGPFTWSQSLAVAVFVFTIGLVVNLIWAEKPVTEPL